MDAIWEAMRNSDKEYDNIRNINLMWSKFKGMINDLMRKPVQPKLRN